MSLHPAAGPAPYLGLDLVEGISMIQSWRTKLGVLRLPYTLRSKVPFSESAG